MRAVVLVVVAIGCSTPPSPGPIVNRSDGCTIAIDRKTGRLAFDGKPLASFAVDELRRVIGPPDRVERTTRKERYEEYGMGEVPSTSDMVEITDAHHVYDRLGLVFRTRNRHFSRSERPEVMLVFLPHARTFDHREPPAAIPSQRGRCTVMLDGDRLDPEIDLRPRGATFRTERAELFGTPWGFTSYASVIDGMYSEGDGKLHVTIQLDGPDTGRASYLEIMLADR